MRDLLMAIVLLALVTSAPSAQSPDLLAHITRLEQSFDVGNRLSGVLLVARGDSVLIHQAFGQRDPMRGVPHTLETPMPVASITKIFTLVALTQLVAEQKVRLSDTISRWVPELPGAKVTTVGQLLNHRAGIPHRVATDGEERLVNTADAVVRSAARHALAFPPGSRSSYSTAGYGVLARILEIVDGRPYADLLRARVFEPAGMTSSYDLTGDTTATRHAWSYLPRDGRLVEGVRRHLSYLAGGGSSVSTAGDLRKFVAAIRGGRLPAVRWEHLAPGGTARWVGASGGYLSWVDAFPDSTTVVWVGNSWGGAATALRDAMGALLRGESPAAPSIPARAPMPPDSILALLEGNYESRPGAFTSVRADHGLRYDDNYLVPTGDLTFWLPSTNEQVRFVRGDRGEITAIERTGPSGSARMPRRATPR